MVVAGFLPSTSQSFPQPSDADGSIDALRWGENSKTAYVCQNIEREKHIKRKKTVLMFYRPSDKMARLLSSNFLD